MTTERDEKKARCSMLPVLQFCGQSQYMAARIGGNRNTVIGTAFHAKCSEAPEFQSIWDRLTVKEREDVSDMIRPSSFDVTSESETIELSYDNAIKEFPIGLDENGSYVPYGDHRAVVDGTVDMHWCVDIGGKKVVYCEDIKKTMNAEPDGPYSLQVTAYSIALCSYYGADGYVRGIWDATNGDHHWSKYVDGLSAQNDELVSTVVSYAQNHGGDFVYGSHFMRCKGLTKCGQWLMPLEVGESTLKRFTEDPTKMNEYDAIESLVIAQRVKETAEEVIDMLKSRAKETGGIKDPAKPGKIWRPVWNKGRASLDRGKLEHDHPTLIQEYTRFGQGFDSFRWTNDKD